jgi:hypothetical protein
MTHLKSLQTLTNKALVNDSMAGRVRGVSPVTKRAWNYNSLLISGYVWFGHVKHR